MGASRHQMRAVDLVEVDEIDVVPVLPDAGREPRDRPGSPVADADRRRGRWEVTGADGRTGDGVVADDGRGARALGPDERAPGSGAAGGRHGGGAPWRWRRWRVVAGVAVAVLVGTGAVVSDRREAARLAAVAELPGVLDLIDSPPTQVWRSEHRLWSPLFAVGDLVVGVSDLWDRSRDIVVVGLDARTGREAWATTVVRSATSPVGGVRCVVPDAPPGGGEADRVVVCLSIDELGPSPQDMSRLEPRRARLLVLSAGTGQVLEDRAVDPSTSVAALGPDLVVKRVTDERRVEVTRTGPRGRDVRWTFTGPSTTFPPEFTFVRSDGDLVVVPGEAGWVLSASDGAVVHAWEPQRPAAAGWADVVRERVLVQPMRDVLGATRIVDLRSGRSFTVDGFPLGATVDDGSTGDLVLVQSAQGEGLLAHEVGTGATRWSVPGEDEGGVLVVDGRVVRAADDGLEAVDATTGAPLWQTSAVRTRQYGLHTDGRVVVRTEREAERGTVLVGRGLDDGRIRWTTDVTDDLEHLVELEGRLYGVTSDGMILFGPGPDDAGG